MRSRVYLFLGIESILILSSECAGRFYLEGRAWYAGNRPQKKLEEEERNIE